MKASCPDCNVLSHGKWCLDQACETCDGKGGSESDGMCVDCCGAGHIPCPTCNATGFIDADPNVSSADPKTVASDDGGK